MRIPHLALVGALVLAIVVPGLALGAQRAYIPVPTFGPQNLYTRLVPSGGWGFTAGSISDPGPTITVSQGETVILDLFATDSIAHAFLLDYDGNNASDAGEPLSLVFSSPTIATRFQFTANGAPGPYFYKCGFHFWAQKGPFVILPGNAVPSVTLTNPDGVAQNRWTGGSLHRLSWTMNDPDGLPSQLAVWVNYTSSAGSGAIAGPPTLPFGATFVDWTVPMINANDVNVRVDVVDPGAAKGTDTALVPVIDSTPPSVASTVPVDGATQVDPNAALVTTFSEAMNPLSGTVAINPSPGGENAVWSSGNTVLTVSHAPMPRATPHTVTLTGFRDAATPGLSMPTASWSFTTANDAPVIAVAQPTGAARWSGGTVHNLQWTTTDTEDAAAALTVWVNYSATGTAPFTPVVGLQAVPGDTTTFAWTVPMDDTTTAALEFTATDTDGGRTVELSPAFAVDSLHPTVQSTSPGTGATGVAPTADIIIVFSEPMARTATEAAVSFAPAIPGIVFGWSNGDRTLTVTHAPMATFTPYTGTVSTGAMDASDPGNDLAAPYVWGFQTGSSDVTPPVIVDVLASPASANPGATVTIAANVTDDVAVTSVAANVTLPDASRLNLTMAFVSGNRSSVDHVWTLVGTYTFTVWAFDGAGNFDSASAAFTIVAPDTTPPVVTHTPPADVPVGDAITVTATVTDDGTVAVVRLVYMPVAGVEQNVSMTLVSGSWTFTIPGQASAGTVHYRIYAVDDAGNEALSQEFAVDVTAAPPEVGTDFVLYAGLGLLLVLVLAGVAFVLLKRKKKGGPEPPPE